MIPIAKPQFGAEEEEAVIRVLRSGMVASGPEVAAFEAEFAAAMGAEHAVAVTNGTVAIQAALECLDVGAGDEVLVPAFTFIATANAVLYTGAEPVFVDIDPHTFCIDPAVIEDAVTPQTKAILPVHLYGHPAPMNAIQAVADANDLLVIGDAAQAHGATLDGKGLGGLADATTWSLYPTKNMTSGEGGMVTTDDHDVAERIRSIANQGRGKAEHGTYDHVRRGSNYRMTDLHAAIGRVQLGHLPAWTARRQAHAAAYTAALAQGDVVAPTTSPGCRHVWHQYTVRTPKRDALRDHLADAGIGSGTYYPKALHEYGHLSRYARSALSESERARAEVLSIPVHPGLTDDEVDRVAKALGAFDA